MAAAQQHDPTHRYLPLEGWRGLCALFVAVLHLPTASHIHPLGLIGNAHLFVDFFFVLSGFVISHAYLARLATAADARIMIWRRIARLWPLHVAMLGAFVALELARPLLAAVAGLGDRGPLFDPASPALLEAIPTHLFFLHSFGLHGHLTWNIPSWSIAAEFWTYIVFAIVMLCTPRRSVLAAIAIAAGGALVVISCSKNLMATHHDLGFFRCLYGFFVGHLVYRLGSMRPMPRALASASEIVCVGIVVAYVSLCGRTALAFAAPLVFGLVILVFAQARGTMSDLLGSRPLVMLGAWSYSIYMVHSLLVTVLHRGLTVAGRHVGEPLLAIVESPNGPVHRIDFGGPVAMDLLTLAYLALLLALSAASWRFIEMPAQKLLNGRAAAPIPAGLLPEVVPGANPMAIAPGPVAAVTEAVRSSTPARAPATEWRLGFALPACRYFVTIRLGAEQRSPNRLAADGQTQVPVAATAYVVAGSGLCLMFGLLCALYLLKSFAGINLFAGASPLHPLYALFFE